MPKPGPKPRFTHNTLQRTAFQIAVNHGLEQLTLGRLAAAVNTSPSAIYRYFSSKEAIVRATGAVALDHAARTLANEPGNNPSQATDFRAAALADILRCFEGWRRYRDEHPVSYELLIPVLLGTDPDSVKRTAPLLRIVEAPLGHAARVGALRPDLSGRRALLFLSSLHGALLHEDPLLGRELLLALLCGWGAPRHLLETLSAPV